jgi:hypothetical protein
MLVDFTLVMITETKTDIVSTTNIANDKIGWPTQQDMTATQKQIRRMMF